MNPSTGRPADRIYFALGAILAFLGISLGAFGTHALRGRLEPEMLAVYEVGVRYQIYHAFALMATAWASTRWPGSAVRAAAWLFLTGTILFSGSLYLLSLTGARGFGAVTPIGGAAQLAGWICLAVAALRKQQR